MNGRMNGWVDEWMNGWRKIEWKDEGMDGQWNESMDGCMYAWMEMDGRMDGLFVLMDGWQLAWMEQCKEESMKA